MSRSDKIEFLIIGFVIGMAITGAIYTIVSINEQENACIKRGGTYAREICFSKGVINE